MTMHRKDHAPLDASFWFWHALVPLLLFAVAAVGCEITHVDLNLADRCYDFAAGNWPARNAWWAQWLIHQRGRDLVVVTALLSLSVWGFSFRIKRLQPMRWAALYLLLAIGLGTGLVALGKHVTNRHCPWDMERYGGGVPYTRLFEGTPTTTAPGHGFPAGHAAGGFSLMGAYFALRDRAARLARIGLTAGVTLGIAFGYGQMARGAHFFSHSLWSAAICWFAALLLYLPLRRFL